MKRVSFTAKFKAEAVKQVNERGHGVVEVSSRLGVSDKSLARLCDSAGLLIYRPPVHCLWLQTNNYVRKQLFN